MVEENTTNKIIQGKKEKKQLNLTKQHKICRSSRPKYFLHITANIEQSRTLDDGGVAGWTVPIVAAAHGGGGGGGGLRSRSCRSPARTGRCRRSELVSRGIRDVDDDGGPGGVDASRSAVLGGGGGTSTTLSADWPAAATSASSDTSQNTSLLSSATVIHNQFSRRAFSVSGPDIWNSLPTDIRLIDSQPAFRRALKTHLFNIAFN